MPLWVGQPSNKLKIVEAQAQLQLDAGVRISKDYAKARFKNPQLRRGDKFATAILWLLLWLFSSILRQRANNGA